MARHALPHRRRRRQRAASHLPQDMEPHDRPERQRHEILPRRHADALRGAEARHHVHGRAQDGGHHQPRTRRHTQNHAHLLHQRHQSGAGLHPHHQPLLHADSQCDAGFDTRHPPGGEGRNHAVVQERHPADAGLRPLPGPQADEARCRGVALQARLPPLQNHDG